MVSTHLALLLTLWIGPSDPSPPTFEVEPRLVRLRGSDRRVQLVVTGRSMGGRPVDLSTKAHYASSNPRVVRVDDDGLIQPTGDGSAVIEVESEGRVERSEVVVTDFANLRPVDFAGEVVPIFSKFGCNSGGCHGKASGQNGFRLSLFGFDPRADHESLVKEGRGRRVFAASPPASLLLKKPTAQVPHGGGKRFAIGSPEYETLVRWIGQGTSFGTGQEPRLVRLRVEPEARVIPARGRQQLRVVAHYEDGSTADVTRLSQFQSNALDLAEVNSRGVIQAVGGVGEAAIMARFGGLVGVARASIANEIRGPTWTAPASKNLIDPLYFGRLKELGLAPSVDCTDAEFARRAALDIGGILPEPAEVLAFEADTDPLKREKWVDQRIGKPEYADFFALKWSIILKNKRGLGSIDQAGTFGLHGWIRQSLEENKPYHRFVAEIVAAKGDPVANPAIRWSLQPLTVEDRADDTAQLFLGLRIQCARCHHHPSDQWSQDDYYGFASLFARIGTKPGPDPNILRVFNLPRGLAMNPTNGEPRKPRPLGAADLGDLGPGQDPRVEFASWLGRADNPFFARALVNRYWKHFLGRGLVEPEDDLRVSNPPTNPELLDALADDFVLHGYDLKRLVRQIATSRAYDRSSLPNEANERDRQNFAHFTARRLPAEVLLDAVGLVTGSPEKFANLPPGFRATQLPDDGFASDFLDVFGRPKRESVCECERSSEANLSQTLHLLNSEEIHAKLTLETSRAARLSVDPRPLTAKVEELYRLALSRKPTDEERRECVAFLERQAAVRRSRQGFEDLIWTLINTKEFLFNH